MTSNFLSTLTVVLAAILIVLGSIGMIVTFMFLWSNDLRDITGAGLGFVAGAVMLGSGVISLGMISSKSS